MFPFLSNGDDFTSDVYCNLDIISFMFSVHSVVNRKAWFISISIFLVLRVVVSLWMVGVRQIFHSPLGPDPSLRPYLNVTVENHPLLEVWQRWDTLHYQAIAEKGYFAFDAALFVPPLYPSLIALISRMFGINTLIAGILISNISFLFMLVSLYQLTYDEFQNHQVALRTLIYFASFPTAFFFLAAYTESILLLAAIRTLFYLRRASWVKAGIWGAIAALSRLPGIFIIIPIAYKVIRLKKDERNFSAWCMLIFATIGVVFFPLYVWCVLKLPPWTPFIIQSERFHGGLAWPGLNLLHTLKYILSGQNVLINSLDLTFILIFLLLTWFVLRYMPGEYVIYSLAFMGLYLIRTGQPYPLLGMTRYVLVFFPAFMLCGKWGSKPFINRLILYPSWVLALFLSGQFAIWGWAG